MEPRSPRRPRGREGRSVRLALTAGAALLASAWAAAAEVAQEEIAANFDPPVYVGPRGVHAAHAPHDAHEGARHLEEHAHAHGHGHEHAHEHAHEELAHLRSLGGSDAQPAHHQCIHDMLMESVGGDAHHRRTTAQQPYLFETVEDEHARRRLADTFAPIRIILDTSAIDQSSDGILACLGASDQYLPTLATTSTQRAGCTAADVLTPEKRDYLKNVILTEAMEWFTDTLSVRPVPGNLVLSNPIPDSSCYTSTYHRTFKCCRNQMPPTHMTSGVPSADFVLYVTARPTSGATIAWALTCQSDQYGRPIAGHANFSPARISLDPKDKPLQLSTAIHEISHALGFSSSKFSSFRKPGTLLPELQSNVVLNIRENNKQQQRIITPNVVAKVKEHFDCQDWPNAGAELEEYGGSGTAGSHWEKRLFTNEFMTGTADPNSVYTAITMALFQDTGWYQVSYDRAEILPWGYGEGCNFVRQTCGVGWNERYFCRVQDEEGCTVDMRYKARCNLVQAPFTLPAEFQYFPNNPNLGGQSPHMDYCPFYTRIGTGDCTDSSTQSYWFFGEAVGSRSRCFAGTYQRRSITRALSRHSGCLESTCSLSTNLLEVKLKGPSGRDTVITCPRGGGVVDLDVVAGQDFTGTLICPPAETICTGDPCDVQDCNGHGTCQSDGSCVCQATWYGDTVYSCDKKQCPRAPGANSTLDCTGHATCDVTTGTCLDESGLPGCFAGFRDSSFGAGDCAEVGCPEAVSSDCPDGQRTCECANHGICDRSGSSGTCVCSQGWIGNDCSIKDCPGVPACGGATRGRCDGGTGICECLSSFDDSAQPIHFAGPNCTLRVEGPRPFTTLRFVGELVNVSGILVPDDGHATRLETKEYAYFNFEVPSVEYDLELVLVVTDPSFDANAGDQVPVMVARYADAGIPSVSTFQFRGTPTTVQGRPATRIVFESCTGGAGGSAGSGGQGACTFSKIGVMNVAVVSQSPLEVGLNLTRDACAALNCQNGATCVNERCDCTAVRRVEPGTSFYATYGWSGELCQNPDCPGTPDCGGGKGRCVVPQSTGPSSTLVLPVCECNPPFTGPSCGSLGGEGISTDTFQLGVSTAPVLAPATTFLPSTGPTVPARTRRSVEFRLRGTVEVGESRVALVIERERLRTVAQIFVNQTVTLYLRLNATNAPVRVASTAFVLPENLDLGATLGSDASGSDATAASQTSTASARGAGIPDPILLTHTGKIPTLTDRRAADDQGWSSGSPIQEIVDVWEGLTGSETGAASVYFVSVFNGRYATARLEYELFVEISAGACPVALQECNGHGNTQCLTTCSCALGWEGVRCDAPVPALFSGDLVSTGVIAPGEWRYFVHPLARNVPGVGEVEVQMRETMRSSRRASPLVVVALDSQRRGTSLAKLTSETALFDFNGFVNRTGSQSLVISLRDHRDKQFVYFGVHNPATARGDADVDLSIVARTTSTLSACDEGESAEDCSLRLCSGKGRSTIVNGQARCVCDRGWMSEEKHCASPRFLDFSRLPLAAQNLEYLCSLCAFEDDLEAGTIVVFKVPQPLQKGTGVRLELGPGIERNGSNPDAEAASSSSSSPSSLFSSVAHTKVQTSQWWKQPGLGRRVQTEETGMEGEAATGDGLPALLVAQSLPRSLLNFAMIASSNSVNQSTVLDSPSPTGSYWIAIYANTAGRFRLQVSRENLASEESPTVSFLDEVADWITGTTSGLVVTIVASVIIGCVLLGCVLTQCLPDVKQDLSAKLNAEREKAREQMLIDFRSTRALEAFGRSKRSVGSDDPTSPGGSGGSRRDLGLSSRVLGAIASSSRRLGLMGASEEPRAAASSSAPGAAAAVPPPATEAEAAAAGGMGGTGASDDGVHPAAASPGAARGAFPSLVIPHTPHGDLERVAASAVGQSVHLRSTRTFNPLLSATSASAARAHAQAQAQAAAAAMAMASASASASATIAAFTPHGAGVVGPGAVGPPTPGRMLASPGHMVMGPAGPMMMGPMPTGTMVMGPNGPMMVMGMSPRAVLPPGVAVPGPPAGSSLPVRAVSAIPGPPKRT